VSFLFKVYLAVPNVGKEGSRYKNLKEFEFKISVPLFGKK
jgi:hypothetical protein